MAGPKLSKYRVIVSQLNRIDPETKEFAPLGRGATLELDPKSPDALRWMKGKGIELAGDDGPAETAADPAEPEVPPNPAQGPIPDPAAIARHADSEGGGVAGVKGTPVGDGGEGVPVS